MISPHAHAAILRKVAHTAVEDARAAWKLARKRPNEKRTRAAFRSCVFAARALRRSADTLPRDREQMIEEAERLDAAAEELKAKLVRLVVGADPAPRRG